MLEFEAETAAENMSSSEVTEDIEITSYPPERFDNREYAGLLTCAVCHAVPSEPVMTNFNHMFCCKSCVTHWHANSGICPVSWLFRC